MGTNQGTFGNIPNFSSKSGSGGWDKARAWFKAHQSQWEYFQWLHWALDPAPFVPDGADACLRGAVVISQWNALRFKQHKWEYFSHLLNSWLRNMNPAQLIHSSQSGNIYWGLVDTEVNGRSVITFCESRTWPGVSGDENNPFFSFFFPWCTLGLQYKSDFGPIKMGNYMAQEAWPIKTGKDWAHEARPIKIGNGCACDTHSNE